LRSAKPQQDKPKGRKCDCPSIIRSDPFSPEATSFMSPPFDADFIARLSANAQIEAGEPAS